MSSRRRSWWPLVLFSLSLVLALATWGCCSARCCGHTARVVAITTGGQVPTTDDTIVLHKSWKQEALWRLPEGSTVTNIAIQLEGKPEPFEKCQTSGGICHIPCFSRFCPSGAIRDEVDATTHPYYRYVPSTETGAASSDPGIRIDP